MVCLLAFLCILLILTSFVPHIYTVLALKIKLILGLVPPFIWGLADFKSPASYCVVTRLKIEIKQGIYFFQDCLLYSLTLTD